MKLEKEKRGADLRKRKKGFELLYSFSTSGILELRACNDPVLPVTPVRKREAAGS